MKRTIISGLLVVLALTALIAADDKKATVLFQTAQARETIQGDLKGAIALYQDVVKEAGSNRTIAAQALVRMAECYRKMGDAESRKIYERIVRDYADQKDAVATARARLDGSAPPDVLTARLVWSDNVIDASASLTPDGRLLAMRDPSTGDIAIRDMSTGQIKRLMAKTGSWSESPEFGNFPVLSPDLRQVVYAWNDGAGDLGNYQVRVLATEAGSLYESNR